ncbi:hypothetical protein [Devosia sp. 2618]|uniref:hypothetical protein n=1 Tax=Devosia sp. 2618 TaxID=3156454 RepID=UPI0033989784
MKSLKIIAPLGLALSLFTGAGVAYAAVPSQPAACIDATPQSLSPTEAAGDEDHSDPFAAENLNDNAYCNDAPMYQQTTGVLTQFRPSVPKAELDHRLPREHGHSTAALTTK